MTTIKVVTINAKIQTAFPGDMSDEAVKIAAAYINQGRFEEYLFRKMMEFDLEDIVVTQEDIDEPHDVGEFNDPQ